MPELWITMEIWLREERKTNQIWRIENTTMGRHALRVCLTWLISLMKEWSRYKWTEHPQQQTTRHWQQQNWLEEEPVSRRQHNSRRVKPTSANSPSQKRCMNFRGRNLTEPWRSRSDPRKESRRPEPRREYKSIATSRNRELQHATRPPNSPGFRGIHFWVGEGTLHFLSARPS